MTIGSARAGGEDGSPSAAGYLRPTPYLDYDHPRVRAFVDEHAGGGARATAVRLYYAVRDGIRYDPYAIRTAPGTYKASYVLAQGRGFCIQKAALYAAACRGAGIPARPGFADVRNHLASERLLRLMQSDLFVYHGYVEVFLDGRWVKATPVFNLALCERFHVRALDFDGREDSLLQPFDALGRQHMEYVRDRGVRDDVPVAEIAAAMLAHYPAYFAEVEPGGDFEAEVG